MDLSRQSRLWLDASPSGVWIADAQSGRPLVVTQALCDLLGVTEGDLLAWPQSGDAAQTGSPGACSISSTPPVDRPCKPWPLSSWTPRMTMAAP